MLYSLGQSLEKSKHAVFTGTLSLEKSRHAVFTGTVIGEE